MKPELEYLITEAGAEAVTDLLLTRKRVTDAEPLIRRLYTRWHDPRKDKFRNAVIAVLKQKRAANKRHLTPSQTKVMALLCQGLTQKEVAERLGTSTSTVSKHCTYICWRVGAKSMIQAIAMLSGYKPEVEL